MVRDMFPTSFSSMEEIWKILSSLGRTQKCIYIIEQRLTAIFLSHDVIAKHKVRILLSKLHDFLNVLTYINFVGIPSISGFDFYALIVLCPSE